jgi:acyl-CoA synthetase (AMP-forming)/AMP-acid ligase II
MRAPALVRGYFNLSEQTARAIRDGWYHTNYVVRRDVVGFYFFVGRGNPESMTNCRPAHLFTSLLRLLGLRFATLSFCRSCRVCYRQPPLVLSPRPAAPQHLNV